MTQPAFFINSSDGSVPKDGSLRKQIRQLAMGKAAKVRREQGKNTRTNIGQYPVDVLSTGPHHAAPSNVKPQCPSKSTNLLLDTSSSQDDSGRTSTFEDQTWDTEIWTPTTIPPTMPCTGYELMRIQYGFDLLDLSALTSFYVGRAAAHSLSIQPSRLLKVLKCRQWSFLQYVPAFYGRSRCLDDAIHCVAIRLRYFTVTPAGTMPDDVRDHYAVALRSLQHSLDDPKCRLEPDVLCATEILAIFELLDFANPRAWTKHIAGASALVKLRGPNAYQTEYEKALLLAMTGPIVTEAFINNTDCFLEHDCWRAALLSTKLEAGSFADCSEIVVNLWNLVVASPRLFKDIQEFICEPESSAPYAHEALVARTLKLREQLRDWHRSYNALVAKHETKSQSDKTQLQCERRFEALGVSLANTIILNRLMIALDPLLGPKTENETRTLAQDIVILEKAAEVVNPRAHLFMAFKLLVVNATIETEEEWRYFFEVWNADNPHSLNLIPAPVLQRWVRLKRRKV